MEAAKCRGCQAPVLFVRNVGGNLMILDAEPVADGNIVIKDGIATVLKGDLWEEMVDGPRHKDHHATCSTVKQFRKPKKKQ